MRSVSILIATRDRCQVLRRTLRDMCAVERDGLDVRWIVIDNGSRDDTRKVVESFRPRLPLQYVFEPRAGKASALNKALAECPIGDVVVFTDDDVTPARDWLAQISEACDRHPEISVFGGRVVPQWPDDAVPAWLAHGRVAEVCFAAHDLGNEDHTYPKGRYPFGGNFWLRSSVLSTGLRFDEGLGPRPRDRLMGGETSFLRSLEARGFAMAYCPAAEVHHRIDEAALSPAAVRRRGYRFGRSRVHWYGPERPDLLARSTFLWSIHRLLGVGLAVLRVAGARLRLSPASRGPLSFEASVRLGGTVESLRVVWKGVEAGPPEPPGVLLVSTHPTHPTSAGNRARILALSELLEQAGAGVHLALLGGTREEVEECRSHWGVRLHAFRPPFWRRIASRWRRRRHPSQDHSVGVDDEIEWWALAPLARLVRRLGFQAVVAEYVFNSAYLECVPPGVRRYVDTHDVFADRHRLFEERGLEPSWFSVSPSEEARGLARADTVLAITVDDARHFRGVGCPDVVTLGHPMAMAMARDRFGEDRERETPTIGLLGSYNAVNLDGWRFFREEVVPLLQDRGVRFKVLLVGSLSHALTGETFDFPLELRSYVTDLGEFYDGVDVVINPVRFGTGLKIKSVEAIGRGRPLVMTEAAAQGLLRSVSEPFLVAGDGEGFAGALADLLDDPDRRNALVIRAPDYVRRHNQSVQEALGLAFPFLMAGGQWSTR